jgi:glucans biosynthesis protein
MAAACSVWLALGASQAARAFDFQDVAKIAKKLATQPYQAPPSVPGFLTGLSYSDYQKIRFLPADSLWHASKTKFQVMLIAPGEYFHHAVQINVVDGGGVHAVPFHKDWFHWPADIAGKIPDKLGYAGFKLTFPLNAADTQNQFLVFAGASYFRGVARNQNFGLSARGIAIDTGLHSGEKFPSFTRFWLVRPKHDAKVMQLYALLDGASLTGAYEFTVTPGAPTQIKVHAQLFTRDAIKLPGFAPLTSMFHYGANTPRPLGQWRPAVHDSGGLLIHSGTGEWLWRPLIDPTSLQMDYFETDAPHGFGLLQRDTRFTAYEDAGARYDNRPSAWVAPQGDWGNGSVVLVEIPTQSETNDNIVAFWTPKKKPAAGHTYDLHYTLSFGAPDIPGEPVARAMATYVGYGPAPGKKKKSDDNEYRLVVDFAGGPLAKLKPDASIAANVTGLDGTKVVGHTVRWVAPSKRWRLSIRAKPAAGKPLALRAFLQHGKQTVSETWSYALPAKNRFAPGG